MNARSFRRKKMAGFLDVDQILELLYVKGPKPAKDAKHFTMRALFDRGLIRVDDNMASLTSRGLTYVRTSRPDLEEWVEPELEDQEEAAS
jgi:hypothetical protein